MLALLKALFAALHPCLRCRRDLILENLALRQQLAVLAAKHPRPQIGAPDRLFWVVLRRFWPGWKRSLVLVQSETVVRWHREGFRLYWKWISRKHPVVGRKPTSKELRDLIFRMVAENCTWGAPRIHGELRMLGFEISERTVLRWMRKAPRNPGQTNGWATFLSNHREAIAAMDSFVVPTLTFGVLYCFFVISHGRRGVLHFNVTRNPTSAWVSQQLREAFPYDSPPRYLIFDREHTFHGEVLETMESLGATPVRTSIRSPWQNGVAERFVGNCRRELTDHVIVLNERHLKRLMAEYVPAEDAHQLAAPLAI
jgi:putative transposase